jgi:uncharacterized delta-60 repeat protein/uncharacterized repeat protein (TIGR02543 family)
MKTNLHPRFSILAATLVAFTQLSTLNPQPASAQSPLPDSFNPGAGGLNRASVSSFAIQADGKILVGGYFTTLVDYQARNYIGRLNADGTLDSGFNPGANYEVSTLVVQGDGRILVGGAFWTLGGQPRSSIGRLNADGTLDSGFDPGAVDSDGGRPWVTALAVQTDGKILVGGNFTTLAGQTRNYIGRLNADGTLDAGFNPGANERVLSLAVQADGKILVGGEFSTLAGQTRNYIGRLNADGTVDSGFNPGAGGWVYSLAVQADGKILVGGEFSTLAGQQRNQLARLNYSGTLDAGFNPGASGGYFSYVHSLAVQANGRILVGGGFTALGGQTRKYLGRLNADGTLDGDFDPEPGDSEYVVVYSLAVQADGKILVGGEFDTLGTQYRGNIGRLNFTEPATQNLSFDGSTITWLRGGTSPEVWRTTFDLSTDGLTWANLGAGTRRAGGWQLPVVSSPLNGVIRARGYVTGGYGNCSGWFVDSQLQFTNAVPTIVENPQSATKLIGATSTFNVTVTGTPPFSFQWRWNSADLADGSRISGARTSTLTITNVQSEDYGFYTVAVSNPWGSVASAPAWLRALTVEYLTLSVSNQTPMSFDFTNTASVRVELTADWWTNAWVFYTLDGSPPSLSSPQYTGALEVSNTVVVRAIALSPVDFSSVEMAPAAINLWTAFHLFATATTGGTVGLAPPGGFYVSNTVVNLTAQPEAIWDFLNWIGDATGTSSNLSLVMDRDKLVTAQFTPIPRYTLTVTTAGSGTVLGNTQSDYLRGTAVNLSATPDPGWEFVGWSGDASGTSTSITVVMDRNKTVTAQFAAIPRYTLTVTMGGSGSVSGNTKPDYLRGTAVNLSATPAPGWNFAGWSGDASGTSSNITVVMDRNKSVTAQFRQFLFTLTVQTDGAGAVSGNTQSNYSGGTTVNLATQPAPEFYFQAWGGDISGTSRNLSVLMDRDKIVVAYFKPLTLLALTAGGGTITANPASNYVQDSTVVLTGQPQSGWTFLNWMGDASGTNPSTTLAMDRPKEVQAVFGTECKTTLAGQGAVVRSFGTGLVPFGGVVRLAAIPHPGYYLGLWGNAASSQVNPLDFTVTNTTPTVSALFVALGANQATLTVREQGAGVVAREPQLNAYTKGQAVRLTAQPVPGQAFLGWSGDATGTQNPLTVAVTTNQTITATFTHRLALAIQPWPGPTQHRGFLFLLAGDEGDTCSVQTSPDLADWQSLTTLTISNIAVQFIDVAVTNHSPRFYRGVLR